MCRLNESLESLNNPLVPSFVDDYNHKKFWWCDPRRIASLLIAKKVRGMYDDMDNKGFKAGGEFTAAIDSARNSDSKILLGDMPIEVTVADLVRAITKSFFHRKKSTTNVDIDPSKDGINSIDIPDIESVDSKSIEDLKGNAALLTKVCLLICIYISSFGITYRRF